MDRLFETMKRNLPSTTSLQCFESAARYSNFTRAAEEMNLTQGAISRQIRLLEEFLGQTLFARHRRRVDLTPAGKALLADTRPLLAELETLVTRLQSFGSIKGSLSVGCYPTLATNWLLPISLDFSEKYPDISVNIVTYTDNSAIDSELFDVGIVQGDPPFRGMAVDQLMPEELIIVASPDLLQGPVDDPRALLSHRSIHLYSRPISWQIWFKSLGITLNDEPGGLFYSQFNAAIEAAKRGTGLVIVPRILVEADLSAGSLVMAHRHIATPKHHYHLVTPQESVSDPRITLFRKWLLANLNTEYS